MIIECFALPEVGKSTIIQDLMERYDIRYVPPQAAYRRGALWYAAKHPASFCFFIVTILKESMAYRVGWQITKFKLSVFIRTVSRLYYLEKGAQKDEIAIIDEGLVQRLLSLYETKQSVKKYESLLSKLPLADSILFLEYTGESDRIRNGRVGTTRRSISEEYTQAWRATMMHNYRSIVEALRSHDLITSSYSRDDEHWFNVKDIMNDLQARRNKYCAYERT
jgi:cytidylate kinase